MPSPPTALAPAPLPPSPPRRPAEPHNLADASGDQPRIPYREYSFLLNERTPKALLETQLVVTPEAGLKAAEMRGGAQGGKVGEEGAVERAA